MISSTPAWPMAARGTPGATPTAPSGGVAPDAAVASDTAIDHGAAAAAQIAAGPQAPASYRRAGDQLTVPYLLELSRLLMSDLELDRVYRTVLRVVQDAVGAERVSLQLLGDAHDTSDTLILTAAQGLPPDVKLGQRTPRGEGLAGWVLARQQPLLIVGATHPDPSVQLLLRDGGTAALATRQPAARPVLTGLPGAVGAASALPPRLHSALCVPLVADSQPLGVLSASTFDPAHPFTVADLDFLRLLAAQVALAVANARLHERVSRLATRDPLTGLLNHRTFHERLATELQRAARTQSDLTLLVLDLDGFKSINDTYGHPAGDGLLRAIADALMHVIRPYDTVARLGGDEFAVLLPASGLAQGELVGGRICRAVHDLDYAAQGLPPRAVTASVGLAHFPTDALDGVTLREIADRGLYHAKSLGKNQVQRGGTSPLDGHRAPDVLRRLLEGGGGATVAMVETLALAVDSRLPAAGHARRVSEYALALARARGHGEAICQQLRLAGLFHDVGKLGVPDVVLQKLGPLTGEEAAVLRQHPVIAADQLLRHVPFLRPQLPAIRHHHERWDGRGYPDRLQGDAIPYGARLLAVVDAYDALTTAHTFSDPLELEDVRHMLASGAGIQWDPALVTTWLEYLERGQLQRP